MIDLIGCLILAVSVALDAAAVSFSGALMDREHPKEHALIAGTTFGGFQFLMPVIGFFLGRSVSSYISSYGHYAAFVLLAFVGGKMIYDVLKNDEKAEKISPFHFPAIIMIAVATSIDAMAVGASLAFIGRPVLLTAVFMGGITMLLSMASVMLGSYSTRFALPEKLLSCIGGTAVILIGVKVLTDHI